MTEDQAEFLRDLLLEQLARDHELTRRVIAALPESQRDYKPHAKALSALDLAWHIVDSETVLLGAIAQGSIEELRPSDDPPESVSELLSYADALVPSLRESVRTLDGATLAKQEPFGDIMQPLVMHLLFVLRHSVHHRGQLTAYLRAMGASVPGPLGRSADER
jgi:uncharacterized damage-inducible protein DinB